GKAKLLRSREKIVSITVNWKVTECKMVLGSAGEAYFIVREDEEVRFRGGGSDGRTGGSRRQQITKRRDSRGSTVAGAYDRGNVELSLCGHLLHGLPESSQHDRDVFQANLLDWERMNVSA